MLAVALATAAALAGAQPAPDRVCQREPPPRPRIEEYMEDRREFGFRSDRAYVRKLVERGRWAYEGWIPVTRREQRYLRLRDRLELGPRAQRYLRRRPHVDGGTSVEDAWPREPYLLVRVTGDRARHTRALKRVARFPDNLRTTTVRYSHRALRRIQDRVDFDAHEADGFHIRTTGVDVWRNRVVIGVITQRTDHRAYFRAHYGPAVVTELIHTELTSPTCTALFAYREDPAGLVVAYEAGGGAEFERAEVTEYDDRVEVAVIVRLSNGPITSDSRSLQQLVPLSRPLGDRRVIDARTGKSLPRIDDSGRP